MGRRRRENCPKFQSQPKVLHLKQTNPIRVKAIIQPALATEKHLAVSASNLYEELEVIRLKELIQRFEKNRTSRQIRCESE
jgi:hypothetical protein